MGINRMWYIEKMVSSGKKEYKKISKVKKEYKQNVMDIRNSVVKNILKNKKNKKEKYI